MNHILVVDDDTIFRNLLVILLRKKGFQVSAAATAEGAIEAISRVTMDLVLLDQILPDIDGLDLLTILRADHPGLPVIMMTGQDLDTDFMQSVVAGKAFAYVSKGATYDRLLPEVERALSTRPV